MGYKLQSGKSVPLFATAIHAIFHEVANRQATAFDLADLVAAISSCSWEGVSRTLYRFGDPA
jgi:hypothetical protein